VFSNSPADHAHERYYGIYRGVVTNTADPYHLNRIKLQVPQILGVAETGWAYSVNNTSPNVVGTGVWVMFEGGDPNFPLWIGAF